MGRERPVVGQLFGPVMHKGFTGVPEQVSLTEPLQ